MSFPYSVDWKTAFYVCSVESLIKKDNMKKLKLQVQISVDGFVGRTNGALDWMNWEHDDKLSAHINALTDSVGSILLGRGMADGFMSYWSAVKPDHPEYAFAQKMLEKKKYIFSKTITSTSWDNTTVINGDLREEVMKLKQESDKDLIVYGGAGFNRSLIANDLIDEFHLFVNPTALHEGLTIFSKEVKLKLKQCVPFDCGEVLLHYEPKK